MTGLLWWVVMLVPLAALVGWTWLSRRPGTIYALDVADHRTGRLHRNDYIGKTRQRPGARWEQHRKTQPWGDLIVRGRVIKQWRRVSTPHLWWAEVWRIVLRQPRLNYQWNLANPRRVPIYTARRQRRLRDASLPASPVARHRAGSRSWQ